MATPTETCTIEITGIPEELLRRLDERVRQQGGDRSAYICEMLERELGEDPSDAPRAISEIFGPSQEGFDQTGMTEEELTDLVEAEVKAYRAERRMREQKGL